MPCVKAGAPHEAPPDATRIAKATSRLRLNEYRLSFLIEAVLRRLAQDLEDMAATLGQFIERMHAVVGPRDLAREKYHRAGLSPR
jgi:hypothetical protein